MLSIIPSIPRKKPAEIANDTPYGLARLYPVCRQRPNSAGVRALRAGMIRVNGASHAIGAPFGGYKQSGIGREGGQFGIEDFMEVKAVSGILD